MVKQKELKIALEECKKLRDDALEKGLYEAYYSWSDQIVVLTKEIRGEE